MAAPLQELFDRHGSDKSLHGYHNIYDPLLGSRREQVSDVLEVGIGTLDPDAVSTMRGFSGPDYQPGASLRAWSDYFPNATIYGLDTQPDTQVGGGRIVTKLCDSTDAGQVNAALPPSLLFDLIVDDGDHEPDSQLATLTNLWPRVKPGGLYVIEDVHAAFYPLLVNVVGPNWYGVTFHPSTLAAGWILIAIPRTWKPPENPADGPYLFARQPDGSFVLVPG